MEGPSSAERARMMAGLVEGWLGNPVSRSLLGFVSKRTARGRRAERVLGRYAGLEFELSAGDRLALNLTRLLLDRLGSRLGLTPEQVKTQLRDGVWRKGLASVLEGLAWRGPEKPFTSACPFLVVWNFTNMCNLHCMHCYQDASPEALEKELSTAEALEAVDTMAEAGVAYIAMSGGEPLVRPDFFDVADRIARHDLGLSVATNGTTLTRETVRRLENYGPIYLQISLDGLRETHNSFRGAECFDRVIDGIRNAVDSSLGVGVSMAVTRLNLREVQSVIDLVEELGADIFMHYNFIPVGRGHEIAKQDLSPEERMQLLEDLAQEGEKRRIRILSTAPQFAPICAQRGVVSLTHFDTFGQTVEWRDDVRFLAEFVGGCGAGRLYWALQPNGDFSPCVFMPITLGNIREDDFLDVWRSSETLSKLRDRASFGGACGGCASRSMCGGCRARAYGYLGDVQGPDPGCISNVDFWRQIVAEMV